MTKIQNLTNAFICIEDSDEKILIDPWIDDGIYLNTWHNFPRVSQKKFEEVIQNVDVCLITHLHKDHFNINTIKKISKNTHFILPKVFAWQVMKKILEQHGFNKITVLECGQDVFESKNFYIKSVPPLNTTGLDVHQDSNITNITNIDAGFVLTHKKNFLKLVFLADDNLYNEDVINNNLNLISNPDLIAFAYSGLATDFPCNYNFSFEEKINIINENENTRFEIQCKNLKKIKPKCIMPYSSEFVPVGQHSKNWIQLLPHIWTSSKTKVAEKYSSFLNSRCVDLYPEEFIAFNGKNLLDFKPSYNREKHNESLIKYYNKIKNSAYNFEDVKSPIDTLFKNSVLSWKDSIIKNNFNLKQNINFYVNNCFYSAVSKDELNISLKPLKEPYLSIFLEKKLFLNLLDGNIHWSDAVLSLRVNWERKPNIFCRDVFSSLNYFRSNKKLLE